MLLLRLQFLKLPNKSCLADVARWRTNLFLIPLKCLAVPGAEALALILPAMASRFFAAASAAAHAKQG